jgi:hypothetical protein
MAGADDRADVHDRARRGVRDLRARVLLGRSPAAAPGAVRPEPAAARGTAALAVTVEVAMLKLDARAVFRFGDQSHLPLADLLWVGLDLSVLVDVPREQHALRRLIGQHARPPALAATFARQPPCKAPAAVWSMADDARNTGCIRDAKLSATEERRAAPVAPNRAESQRMMPGLVRLGRAVAGSNPVSPIANPVGPGWLREDHGSQQPCGIAGRSGADDAPRCKTPERPESGPLCHESVPRGRRRTAPAMAF